MKYLTLHVTILLLLATMPASAQGFDKGFAAYMIGDYATALTEWRRRAELGSVTAQANLGNMYEVGAGVAQSNILAHQWYNLAASNGDATARESREKLVDKMTSAEVSKAVATAKKCMISGYLDCG